MRNSNRLRSFKLVHVCAVHRIFTSESQWISPTKKGVPMDERALGIPASFCSTLCEAIRQLVRRSTELLTACVCPLISLNHSTRCSALHNSEKPSTRKLMERHCAKQLCAWTSSRTSQGDARKVQSYPYVAERCIPTAKREPFK